MGDHMTAYERYLNRLRNRAFGAGFACGSFFVLLTYLWIHSV